MDDDLKAVVERLSQSATFAEETGRNRCDSILASDLRTLLSALRQRDEDAERLDWLDRVNAATNEHNGTTYGWRYDINHNRAALTDHNHPALTVRDAIDVARGVKTATEAAGTSREARAILIGSETNAR